MIVEVKMYTVDCDNCGKNYDEGTDYSCWNDPEAALTIAKEGDFIEHEGKHYCPDCYSYDDNDVLIIKTNPPSSEDKK